MDYIGSQEHPLHQGFEALNPEDLRNILCTADSIAFQFLFPAYSWLSKVSEIKKKNRSRDPKREQLSLNPEP